MFRKFYKPATYIKGITIFIVSLKKTNSVYLTSGIFFKSEDISHYSWLLVAVPIRP